MDGLREHFPWFKAHPKALYFDSSATTHKPSCMLEALLRFYGESNGTVHRSQAPLSESPEGLFIAARQKVARFLNVSPDALIWTKGTTESLNLLASSIPQSQLKAKDVILVSAMEHHSNLLPWQRLAKERGARLQIIPLTASGDLDLKAFSEMLNDRVKIVAVAHISNVLGSINPLKEIVALAAPFNAWVCVDGAQSFGSIPVDVSGLGVDFYAASAHKAFGPTGLGILTGKKERLERLSPYHLGGGMVEFAAEDHARFLELPYRLEAGTPSIGAVIAFGAVIDFIESIGLEKMAAYKKEIGEKLFLALCALPGWRPVSAPKNRAPIYSFFLDHCHPYDLAMLLSEKKVTLRSGFLCAEPLANRLGGKPMIRLSPSIYNLESEIDELIALIKLCESKLI